jgi:hypothetical protein
MHDFLELMGKFLRGRMMSICPDKFLDITS